MTTIDKSFTATGSGVGLLVKHNESFTYSVSGTFVATVKLERTNNNGISYEPVLSFTGAGSGTIQVSSSDQGGYLYRFRCHAFTSGTVVTSLADVAKVLNEVVNEDGTAIFRSSEEGVTTLKRVSQKRIISAGAKAGNEAGWLAGGGGVDIGICATLPESQTISTLVVPVSGLKVGDTITSYHAIGQIESAGGSVALTIDFRKLTSAAADVTDASVGAITPIAVTADTILSATNAGKTGLTEVVAADETFYFLLTGTTDAATDIALQGFAVVVTEV